MVPISPMASVDQRFWSRSFSFAQPGCPLFRHLGRQIEKIESVATPVISSQHQISRFTPTWNALVNDPDLSGPW